MTPWPAEDSPQARLAAAGADACSSPELLAIVLAAGRSGGLPASRVAASALLERVGGLAGLSGMSPDELRSIGELGRARASVVVAARERGRRAAAAWPDGRWHVRTPADVALRLVPEMGRLEREELRVVLLNTRNAVVACGTVYVGNLAGSLVRVGEVYRDAVRRNAAAVMVVHNHPSGDPSPSAEDMRITRELDEAGRLLDIHLLDHLIIGHDRWLSLRAMGVLAT